MLVVDVWMGFALVDDKGFVSCRRKKVRWLAYRVVDSAQCMITSRKSLGF